MRSPLDPLSLRLFVAVCELGSLARAAEREAMVPSALSKRIAALEADLGTPLLVRRRRGVESTAAGQALLGRAREILTALDRTRTELGAFAHGVQGSVRLLASPSALAERLPDDLARFLALHPELRVSVDERVSPDIVQALHDGAADLGVLWDQAPLAGLETAPYRQDRLCVVMAPGHHLADRPSLRFAEMLDEDSVGVATGGLMDRLLHRQAALLGRTAVSRIQVSSMDAACRIVAAGLGLAILPLEIAAPHARGGRLRMVRLDEPWALRHLVMASRLAPLRPAATSRLIDFLRHAGGASANPTD
ncbi:MAG: LysR family transcriptional regulator [Burkholderiales bacterium]|nr:LysR family transcriptional regulator [Burkholderiales bacterium]